MSKTSAGTDSIWAPMRVAIFRALWIAVLVSNIGAWMQTVGAQWLLVDLPNAALLVALVQTADMLPDVLLAYVGGVIADIFDRRLLLIVVQAFLVVTGLVLNHPDNRRPDATRPPAHAHVSARRRVGRRRACLPGDDP
jgi:Transmembrane secretion effector